MDDEVLLVALEQFVTEDMFLFTAHFVKVVHVKLSHEAGEILVPEVDRKDFLLELLDVLDVKA